MDVKIETRTSGERVVMDLAAYAVDELFSHVGALQDALMNGAPTVPGPRTSVVATALRTAVRAIALYMDAVDSEENVPYRDVEERMVHDVAIALGNRLSQVANELNHEGRHVEREILAQAVAKLMQDRITKFGVVAFPGQKGAANA